MHLDCNRTMTMPLSNAPALEARETGGIPQLASHEVFVQQVDIMIRQARRGAFAALLAVVAVASLLLPTIGWTRVGFWAFLVALAVALRSIALRYIHRLPASAASSMIWERVLTGCTALLGLCVASGALIFFPASDFRIRALITVIFCSWPAGGAAVLGAHPRSYSWYLGLYFPTLALAWLIYEPEYPAVIALMALFAYVLVFLSKEIGRLVVTSATLEKQKDTLLEVKDKLIAELHVARRSAEEANLSKSRFLAAASHDLRQPVIAISILAGTLDGLLLDAKGRKIFNRMSGALDSLEDLFDAILDLSRLDAGAVTPEPTTFNLGHVVQGLASEYEPRMKEKELTLQCTPASIWLFSDRIMVERILRNLFDNALKYTIAGTVTVAMHRSASGCSVSVEDTGVGIPSAEQANIFEDFYQLARKSSAPNKGLGLGLAIVRGFADALGMTVTVRSTPGRGSTFTITAPRALIVDEPLEPASARRVTTIDLSNRVVVVVDDVPQFREAFKQTLVTYGAVPIAAGSVDEAIVVLRSAARVPDLFIVDYHLGEGVLGTDAIAAIQRIYPGLPCLVVTADGAAGAAVPAGIPVLRKPVTDVVLAAHIARLLQFPVTEL
jgi:signal transduction histidine kinase/CheY-like chemotaxis protein